MWSHEVRYFFFFFLNRRWKLNTFSNRAVFSWQDFLAMSVVLWLSLPLGVATLREKKKAHGEGVTGKSLATYCILNAAASQQRLL